MFLGILVPFMNNFGKEGYYNSQEIGLAKALSELGNRVIVYKFVKEKKRVHRETIKKDIEIEYLHAKSLGSNGIITMNKLNSRLDALLCFSDLQIIVPSIYKWCKKNNVLFIPYIGVFESHSTNRFFRKVMDLLSYRNLKVYQQCYSLAKNKVVYEKLEKNGVKKIKLIPVGIDLDKVNWNYKNSDIIELKKKYGYRKEDKIILFIGRLEIEKEPINLIRLFSKKYSQDFSYRLLIVGEGVLQEQVDREISANKLERVVKQIKNVPNKNIWELYRISDCLLNLNKQEIFGMVILESMFYETKTIAWHAPGPDLIIENEKSGFLVKNEEELYNAIDSKNDCIRRNAHKRIVDLFTWDKIVKDIDRIIQDNI